MNKIFTTDFNIDRIFSCRVDREAKHKYSCLEVPRRSDGIILTGDYNSTYECHDGRWFYAEAGDVLFLPKGSRYTNVISDYGEQSVVHHYLLNFRITDSNGSEISPFGEIVKLSGYDSDLRHLFRDIANCYRNADMFSLKSKVYKLFGDLFPISDEDECCISYINRHYTKQFSIPELAEKSAMCETAYRKRFKKLTGFSPVQYINRLKIEKACEMLRAQVLSPADISDYLNFYSLPYFYKVFKDVTGMTPNEFKATCK